MKGGQGMSFKKELGLLLNKYSMENGSDTPDFVLARFIEESICAFDNAVTSREEWYGRYQMPDIISGQEDNE